MHEININLNAEVVLLLNVSQNLTETRVILNLVTVSKIFAFTQQYIKGSDHL